MAESKGGIKMKKNKNSVAVEKMDMPFGIACETYPVKSRLLEALSNLDLGKPDAASDQIEEALCIIKNAETENRPLPITGAEFAPASLHKRIKNTNECIKTALYLLGRAEKMSTAVYAASTILELNSTILDETQLLGLSTLLESVQTDFDNECHIHHTSIDTLKVLVELSD